MDGAAKYTMKPHVVQARSLDRALMDSQVDRLLPWQNYQAGIDLRSGSLSMRDANNQRIFIGVNVATGRPVAKLSQAGYDAESAEPDQLIWSSDDNVFKIVETGTASILSGSFSAGSEGSQADIVDLDEVYASRPTIHAFFDEGLNAGAPWTPGFHPIDYVGGPPGSPISINTAEIHYLLLSTTGDGRWSVAFTVKFINATASTQNSRAYSLRWYSVRETSAAS